MAGWAATEIGSTTDTNPLGYICTTANSPSANWTCQVPNGIGGFATLTGVGSNATGGVNVSQLTGLVAGSIGAGAIVLGDIHTVAKGDQAVAIGSGANATGPYSIAIGNLANAAALDSVAIGPNAGAGSTNAISSTFLGAGAGQGTSGSNNTAIGAGAGNNVDGSFNVNAGTYSGQGARGNRNAGLGFAAGMGAVGDDNIAIGTDAGINRTGDRNIALGMYTGNSGNANDTVTIGSFAGTQGDNSVVIGTSAQGFGANAVATGNNAWAEANAVATGTGAQALSDSATATGNAAVASGIYAAAYGRAAQANGDYATALGPQANASGELATAVGFNAAAADHGAVSIGVNSSASKSWSVALGDTAQASADYATALGSGTRATNEFATAIGANAKALEHAATAIGSSANAAAQRSLAIGDSAQATSSWAAAIGGGAKATGFGSSAIGPNAGASARSTLAMGDTSRATSDYAMAMGAGTVASAAYGVALGAYSVASTTANSKGYVPTGADAAQQALIAATTKGSLAPVSVGSSTSTRQIQNVAAGGTDTDAVNVSQLRAVSAAAAAGAVHYYSVNDNGVPGANYDNTGAAGANSLAAGVAASAKAANAVAIGNKASVDTSAFGAIAIGDGAQAAGVSSISIGTGNAVSGARSGAIGDPSFIGADDSYAIGNNNTIAASARQSFVLGNNVSVTNANNVVLGNNSADKAAVQVSGATIPSVIATLNPDGSVTYSAGPAITYGPFAGTATGVVSVGAAGTERQIVNVAPGAITATSTDAVNGSQLYQVASTVSALGGSITTIVNNAQTHYYSVNGGATPQANYANDGATGANALAAGTAASAAGINAVAVGNAATASAANSMALGNGASASVDNSVALGNGSATTAATPTASVTIQGQTYNFAGANPAGVVSVGSAGAERQIQNVAAGQLSATSTDAVNGSQLYATNQAINNIQTGGGIKYFHANSQAADSQAAGAESVAIGPQAIALGASAIATGNGAQANGAGSIALGANAIATSSNGVAIGNGSAADRSGMNGQKELFSNVSVLSTQGGVSVGFVGKERQLTNVAGGTQATDAVNVRQLQAVQQSAVRYDTNVDGTVNYNSVTMGNGGSSGPVTVHNVAPGVAPTDAVNVQQLNQVSAANTAYTDARVNALGSDIRAVARNAYAGTAAAMAVQMPGSYVPGKTVMRIGYGTFKGESAVGVSFRRTAENNSWSLTGGVGVSRAGAAATVGAEWVFN